jgi:hypothetical protein
MALLVLFVKLMYPLHRNVDQIQHTKYMRFYLPSNLLHFDIASEQVCTQEEKPISLPSTFTGKTGQATYISQHA